MPSDESKYEEAKEGADEVDIVKEVSKFFYENDDFAGKFEKWVNDNAHIIDEEEIETTGVMKLEYTELYEKYQLLFESELEGFIESKGSTINDFFSKLQKATDKDPEGEEAIFAMIITATADFDIFMQMMRDAARNS